LAGLVVYKKMLSSRAWPISSGRPVAFSRRFYSSTKNAENSSGLMKYSIFGAVSGGIMYSLYSAGAPSEAEIVHILNTRYIDDAHGL
jgi:hypothetical protein